MIETQVYDNFLKQEELETMRQYVLKNVEYGFNTTTNDSDDLYFNHVVWKGYQSVDRHYIKSQHFEAVLPLLHNIHNIKSLIRVKINCYTGDIGGNAKKHKDHVDLPFSHYGGIFSLNTCDGGTWINNKKYDSIENRLLIFDAGRPHSSSNTTNSDIRMNININWL